MNGTRKKFFARPCLAINHDGRIGLRNGFDCLQHAPERAAAADDLLEIVFRLNRFFEIKLFFFESVFERVNLAERKSILYSDGDMLSDLLKEFRIFFGESITVADVIMSDGKSLEHVGVTPDELVLPTPAELAAGRDVVLSRAAALLGATLDPVKAATLYTDQKKK